MATREQIRRRGRASIVVGALIAAVALAAVAWGADTIFTDGDTAAASPNIHYSDTAGGGARLCNTRGSVVQGAVTINYNGGGSQHYDANESLNVTLTPSDSDISASVVGTPQIPADWDSNDEQYTFNINTTVPSSSLLVPDGTYSVEVNVEGASSGFAAGAGDGLGKPKYNLIVACAEGAGGNQSPVAEANGPYSGDEGSAIQLSSAGSMDVEGSIASYLWSYSKVSGHATASCGFGGGLTATSSAADPTIACNDNGSFTVSLTVTDNLGTSSPADTASLTVDNLAPGISTAATPFELNSFTGVATARFDFSDAGTNDTHGSNLSYFVWSGISGNQYATVSETNGAGTASNSQTFSSGCYTISISGTAVDDDLGASAPLGIVSNYQVDVYSMDFLPPLQRGEKNISKHGNVVPVKVRIASSCTGAAITSADLYVTLAKKTAEVDVDWTETNVVTESVSAADSGQKMRVVDSMYLYNLATKPVAANTDYAVRVRLGSTTGPILLEAGLYPKK